MERNKRLLTKKKVLFGYLGLIILLLSSCASTAVFSDYNRSLDFKSYKTFAWLPKTHDPKNDGPFDNQIVETNIKNLGSGELKSRGYKVDVDEPDLLIDFYVDVANKVDHVSTPVYGYAYNYNSNFARPYNNNLYSYRNSYYNNNSYINSVPVVVGYNNQDIPYEEGTLTILIIDRKTNTLVWKGWSVGTVTDESSFEYELPSDMRRLFKEFPVMVIAPPKTKSK
ncbi:MAG: DUF4136 domain-containing protein [Cytophagaceae bacterium]|nr:DUF4136 domain-containing protein [Cytophagaceae bacterium]